jgi:ferrous iron transport protein B
MPYIESVLSREEALMIAEGDEYIAKSNNINLPNDYIKIRNEIYKIRRNEVEELSSRAFVKESKSKRALIGRLLLNPIIGSLVAILVLYTFLYQFLGVFVAGTIVDILEINIFNKIYEPFISGLVNIFFPVVNNNIENLLFKQPLAALGTFLAGDYGVLTLTVTYLYGLLMPLVLGFYFGLAILEDSGYLPRLAVLTDGLLSKLGMNGRAIIPLILGGGCVTMAVVTTRLLKSNKEKIITMALLGLTIPCSAQLGVIQGLLSNVGGILPWLIWGLTLFTVFGITGLIMNKVLDGDCGNFISDIPPMRIPRFTNILKKTFTRSKVFLDEATPAFFVAAAVVAFLQVTGCLEIIIKSFEPIISNVLLLPKEVALSFILGMIRRDFGAFGLLSIPMSASQLVTACVVLTLFVPCIATVAVMIKEKNWETALAIWLSSWALALGLGAVLARIIGSLGI